MNARQVVTALRGRWHGSYGMCQCPAHNDGKEPGLKILDGDNGEIVVNCFAGCDWQDVKAALRQRGLLPDLEQTAGPYRKPVRRERPAADVQREAQERQGRIAAARAIWQAARPTEGTVVETYLRERGIRPPIPASIRYTPALRHGPTGLMLPGMVAGVQDADGHVVGVHRTFLTGDGRKSPISQNKMMLGPCAGGAVRLDRAGEKLVLGEGLETSLSVQQATGLPTWATLSTSGLKAVVLPPEVHEVIIAADGDEAGKKAANEAAQRFLREGRRARIASAPLGFDFNDVLQWSGNVVSLDDRRQGEHHG